MKTIIGCLVAVCDCPMELSILIVSIIGMLVGIVTIVPPIVCVVSSSNNILRGVRERLSFQPGKRLDWSYSVAAFILKRIGKIDYKEGHWNCVAGKKLKRRHKNE